LAEHLYPIWKLWRDHYAADERIDRFLARANGDRELAVAGHTYTWQEVIDALGGLRREKGFLPAKVAGQTDTTDEWAFGHQPLVAACATLQELARDASELLGPRVRLYAEAHGRESGQRHQRREQVADVDEIAKGLDADREVVQLIDNVNRSYWDDALGAGPTADEQTAEQFADRLFGSWPVADGGQDSSNERARRDLSDLLGIKPSDAETWQAEIRRCEHRIAESLTAQQEQLYRFVDERKVLRTGSEEIGPLLKRIKNLQTLPGGPLLSEHLALHITASLMGDTETAPHPIDFIQVSADIDCPADPTRLEAADKARTLWCAVQRVVAGKRLDVGSYRRRHANHRHVASTRTDTPTVHDGGRSGRSSRTRRARRLPVVGYHRHGRRPRPTLGPGNR
jgi:hypothetical protein